VTQSGSKAGRAPDHVPSEVGLAQADRALELAGADPRRALALAEALLERADIGGEGRAVAERAAALAELGLGRVAASRARFERARDRALADGVLSRLPEIQIGLAIVLLQSEEPVAAMAEIDAALVLARDRATLGQVQSQRATILMRLGRYPEALEQATIALASCRFAGLAGPVARLLSNQGIVHAYLGDYEEAEVELQEALALLRRQGSDLGVANVVHNLGFVAARRGDIPAALAHFDEAFRQHVRLGIPSPAALTDRCEVLMSARLLPEARAAAAEAIAGLQAAGQAADLAEARLMLAAVAFAGGDFATARSAAEEASEALARQGRNGWAVLGRFVAARATWATEAPLAPIPSGLGAGRLRPEEGARAAGTDRRRLAAIVPHAGALARELRAAGWRLHALEALIIAARAAIAAGEPAQAVSLLAAADVAASARHGASSDERVRAWFAVALGRLAGGDSRAALSALRTGLQVAEEHRAAFGATELRARATLASSDLAELGLEIAVGEGSPAGVLEWSERWRARSLWPPEVLPPPDRLLAEGLSQLRHTVAALELVVQAGEGAGAEAQHLVRRRKQLEASIRHRSLGRGRQRRPAAEVPTVPEVQARLGASGSGAVVELVAVAGQLHAVVCTQASCVVRQLGSTAELARWRAAARFALTRLALGRSSYASLVAAGELLGRAASAVDRLLFEPIVGDLSVALTADRPELVIVPTGTLHSLPWALLPSLRERPLSVAPSLALFMKHSSGARPGGATVLVAAPGVPSADVEVAALKPLYREAVTLAGRAATAEAVATALQGAARAHVVAHGRFRADNALFSALDLADGPLTVYDLEQIGEGPELLVLSSCDAGRSDVQPGDELMGAAAAMLSLGSRAIVASVVPVPDAGAPSVMAEFHAQLGAGLPPSSALAVTQAAHGIRGLAPEELADRSLPVLQALAAAGFVCLGAGGRPATPPCR
jgi:tetratricopeptide (TPR) repeat protein